MPKNSLKEFKIFIPQWVDQLHFGWSLLVSGIGSKMALLERIAAAAFPNVKTMVIHGQHQDLKLDNLISTINDTMAKIKRGSNTEKLAKVKVKSQKITQKMLMFYLLAAQLVLARL
jgi:hypothetical protein